MIIYIISTIFILGFPKYYTNDMSENMSNQYAASPLCRLNIKLNNNFKNVDCLQKDDNFVVGQTIIESLSLTKMEIKYITKMINLVH